MVGLKGCFLESSTYPPMVFMAPVGPQAGIRGKRIAEAGLYLGPKPMILATAGACPRAIHPGK